MDHHIQKVIAVMPSWATHPVAGICTLIGLETKEDVARFHKKTDRKRIVESRCNFYSPKCSARPAGLLRHPLTRKSPTLRASG